MNYLYAESPESSAATARSLAGRTSPRPPSPPDDGSLTAAALREAASGWAAALGAADAAVSATLDSVAAFLRDVAREDARLARALHGASPGKLPGSAREVTP